MSSLFILLVLPLIAFGSEFVLVSVYPFYDVVRELSGGRFRVEVLIPPRADYHLYELSSREVIKLSKAKVVFVSGIPLGGWEEKVEKIAGDRAVPLAKNLKLRRYDGHGEARYDPHLWLSPKRMLGVARNAYEGLVKHDPEGKELYNENFARLLSKLKSLDREFERAFKNCRYRVLPVVHPALSYLAEDYGLNQLSIGRGGVHGGVSPRELASFLKNMRKLGIDFVFSVYGSRSKVADVLEKEYGLRVYRLNVKIIPLPHRRDYFSIMRYNLKVLREALECM